MSIVQTITPFFEIVIITVIINYLLSFFWNTKSMDLVFGVLAFFLLFAISSWLQLPVLHTLMLVLGNAAVIALLIIFQPELRVALSKLSVKGKRYREISAFDKFLEALSSSVYRMSDKKIGALIAIENEDSLEDLAQKSVLLHADFSPELLETLFATTTPLHDGAVIIREKTLLAAAVILPLAEDTSQLAKAMGTRHRAALGLSLTSDALVIVVSEESGKVSIAREGVITRGIKIDRFKGIIRSLFNPPPSPVFKKKFHFFEWLRQ